MLTTRVRELSLEATYHVRTSSAISESSLREILLPSEPTVDADSHARSVKSATAAPAGTEGAAAGSEGRSLGTWAARGRQVGRQSGLTVARSPLACQARVITYGCRSPV